MRMVTLEVKDEFFEIAEKMLRWVSLSQEMKHLILLLLTE